MLNSEFSIRHLVFRIPSGILNSVRNSVFQALISAFVAAPAYGLTVVVDPGHGGRDDGAVREGLNEAAITLEVGKQLFALLKKDSRFKAYITRDENVFVSLPARAELAKTKKADVFISIHVNSSPDPKAHGAEFYFQNQLPPDEESMALAHKENSQGESGGSGPQYAFIENNRLPADVSAIVGDLLDADRVLKSSQLSKALRTSWRGSRKSKNGSIRQAPFFVLSQMTPPSTLVELGFLTHPDDVADLTNSASQKRMAEDIYRGLISYKESMDKTAAGQ
jgi:N-acetylmuramoyl-L-alanine amidase